MSTKVPIKRQRCWWGWGYEDSQLTNKEIQSLANITQNLSSITRPIDPPKRNYITLEDPRFNLPDTFKHLSTIDPFERLRHASGSSFIDVTKKLNNLITRCPDYVLYPRSENEIIRILDFASSNNIAVVIYGAGSSVVGGVSTEGEVFDDFNGIISLDLENLNKVIEIDKISLAGRIQAGIYGPELENQLRPFDLTLRHFPQSFECSSLGGWVATRSGGHYATGPTHIDDFIESIRAITPNGIFESRRLPGSGAGPSPDRIWLGSEGTLGVITEVWIRLTKRIKSRSSLEAHFSSFKDGYLATKAIVQSGLKPSNCRLIEATEALINGASDGKTHLLLLAFESAELDTKPMLNQAEEILKSHKALIKNSINTNVDVTSHNSAAKSWKASFTKAPYTRDALIRIGVVVETFETAITWDKFEIFNEKVLQTAREIIKDVSESGWITCRFTHVYPDGPAPYYSVVIKGQKQPQDRIKQWQDVKQAVSDAIISNGATITHHHAIGRDHVPYYHKQIPQLHLESLKAIKKVYDPNKILNPGILGV